MTHGCEFLDIVSLNYWSKYTTVPLLEKLFSLDETWNPAAGATVRWVTDFGRHVLTADGQPRGAGRSAGLSSARVSPGFLPQRGHIARDLLRKRKRRAQTVAARSEARYLLRLLKL